MRPDPTFEATGQDLSSTAPCSAAADDRLNHCQKATSYYRLADDLLSAVCSSRRAAAAISRLPTQYGSEQLSLSSLRRQPRAHPSSVREPIANPSRFIVVGASQATQAPTA